MKKQLLLCALADKYVNDVPSKTGRIRLLGKAGKCGCAFITPRVSICALATLLAQHDTQRSGCC